MKYGEIRKTVLALHAAAYSKRRFALTGAEFLSPVETLRLAWRPKIAMGPGLEKDSLT